MHYHWQVLVHADDQEEAIEKMDEIMNMVGGDGKVWDYWGIGWENEKKPVVRATTKSFWDRIQKALNNQQETMLSYQERIKQELERQEITLEDYIFSNSLNDNTMLGYPIASVCDYKQGNYQTNSFLATDGDVWGSPQFPDEVKEKVIKYPEEYWLVSIDLHN